MLGCCTPVWLWVGLRCAAPSHEQRKEPNTNQEIIEKDGAVGGGQGKHHGSGARPFQLKEIPCCWLQTQQLVGLVRDERRGGADSYTGTWSWLNKRTVVSVLEVRKRLRWKGEQQTEYTGPWCGKKEKVAGERSGADASTR